MTAHRGGRVAVITGASRGLGAGMALRFAAAGVQLGLCARHRPAAPPELTPPAGHGDDAAPNGATLSAAVDVTDRAALERFAAAVTARFGRIDLWVNNAGLLGPIGPLAETDAAAAAEVLEVNVAGVLHGSAVFASHVRSRAGAGVLVNLSSGAAVTPVYGWAAYCASKAAVDQLTRVVALEEAAHGLVAYALSPGLVDTGMQEAIRASDEEDFPDGARFRQAAEDHRFNAPAWVADFVLELAFGAGPAPASGDVVLRVPDQPVPGRTG